MKIAHVRVPATTANLGPGFDAIGLALDLWNEAKFFRSDNPEIRISVTGEGQATLPADRQNAILAAALQLFELAGKNPEGLTINCLNRIPLVSGMGSSSAALLTGFMGANSLLGSPLSSAQVLTMATNSEGHPDNVVPAMLGGLVASAVSDGRVVSRKLLVSPTAITVVLPDFYFPTQIAREILPETIPLQKAVFNLSRAVLVIKALETGDLELLGEVMEDSLHQPHRLPLIPGALAAIQAGKKAGASAVALSGAGPSLVAFSGQPADPRIGAAMQQAFEQAGLKARVFPLNISQTGASVLEYQADEEITSFPATEELFVR
jgi:homoserine kinase